ncbi:MAG TPA: sigma-54-dependent Fis family transcriptional regulator, partial [Fibrobacteres bacterium]|nr:sigma-54-dependent Fis family transcriptional regulator [Fibrobacterota bacterium]
LEQLAEEGKFRRDLLYRLKVVHIALPPLRERIDDILPLVRNFMDNFRARMNMPHLRLSPATLDVLMNYSWPGNVRELQNALEHASVLCTDGNITPDVLPASVNGRTPASFDNPRQTLKELEGEHIRRVLDLTKGNRSAAAAILGIGEATLYRRLKENRE